MPETLDVRLWRGAVEGRYEAYEVPLRAEPDRARRRHLGTAQRRCHAVLPLRLPRRHVRLLRHDGQRPAALDLPHPRLEGGIGRPPHHRAAGEPAGHQGSGGRHAPVLREMAGREGACSRRRRRGPIRSSALRPTAPPAGRRTRRSSASIAASAMPRATPCAGTPTIWAPPRSTAPGRWSTTSAMPATRSASLRSPPTAAATPATRTSPARSIVRWRSTRPPRSRVSSVARMQAYLSGEIKP